jgi:hypothetical protein
MATATEPFSEWLAEADVAEQRLNAEQRNILQAAHRFRQSRGRDYYSSRLLGHFLLHCHCGLKVAHIARLLHISRPTASRQQGLSSKETIQQAHHRLDGRPAGKLLPRYAGAIARFLHNHPDASRAQLLDFIETTFAVRVSRTALFKFLKKYGLDQIGSPAPAAALPPAAADTAVLPQTLPAATPLPAASAPPVEPARHAAGSGPVLLPAAAPAAAPPFSTAAPSTPAPSC